MASAKATSLDARLYRSLHLIRAVEEEVARVYPSDKIKSPVHLSIGQEAVSSGVCDALKTSDVVFGSYRCHALYLAKGGDLKGMVAELYGKRTGCAGGKGGSMHLLDRKVGMMGASAVVGTTISHATGYAWAQKRKKKGALVASFFGDGSVEEGSFHESLNFASLKKLPLLFICENNFYAIHTRVNKRQAFKGAYDLARGYGLPSRLVDDGDVYKIRKAAAELSAKVRAGQGPAFLECHVYRWKEHVGPAEDFDAGYRTREEAKPWIDSDPVRKIGSRLAPALRNKIELENNRRIREAFEFAEKSPEPHPSELTTDLYAAGGKR